MKNTILSTLTLCSLSASALAGEVTVEPGPFQATVSLDGTLIPSTGHQLQIELDGWAEMKILELKEQGSAVAQGEAVVELDLEGIERKIEDDRVAAELREIALRNAERELANLKISTEWKLEVAKRNFERTAEDWEYFKEVGRELSEESTKRSVDRARRMLENQEEELRQLLKMYEEDDLTEETEEIILKRQQNAVNDSKFYLRRAEISAKHTLEVELPRKATDLEQGFKDAELTWKSQKEILPRALEQKSLEVETLRVQDRRAREKETEILSDRKRMEPTSPIAGRVYYGEFLDGRWDATKAAKFMKAGGLIPSKTIYATVVPEGAVMELHAYAGENVIAGVHEAKSGYFSPNVAPRKRISVTVKAAAHYPGVGGQYHVELSPGEGIEGPLLVPGMKGKITLVTFQAEDALVVPVGALKEEADGSFSVRIKLADGESEKRTVRPGAESGGKVQIVEGLEAGQVVLVEGAE